MYICYASFKFFIIGHVLPQMGVRFRTYLGIDNFIYQSKLCTYKLEEFQADFLVLDILTNFLIPVEIVCLVA